MAIDLLQVVVNGVIAGSIYALMALGFTLIYSVARFFIFSHGAIFTIGAYLTYTLLSGMSPPVILVALIVFLLTALVGTCLELGLYRPLRSRKGGSSQGGLNLLLASLAFLTITNIVISIVYGDIPISQHFPFEQTLNIIGLTMITEIQLIVAISSVVFAAALFVWIKYSGTGTAIRAVAGNFKAAKLVGISTQRVIVQATFVGSGLAGVAGFLISLDQALTPTMGVIIVTNGIVAAIFGGLGSVFGALIGGMVLGIVENFSVLVLPGELKPLSSFLILIVLLMLRPHGLLGVRDRESM